MKVGQGCKVHLREDELPSGRIIVSVSKHLTAVIDGGCHDTYDPSRDGYHQDLGQDPHDFARTDRNLLMV